MFAGQSIKNAHIKYKHSKKLKGKICPYCSKAFDYQPSFEAHVARHTDDRQYSCEECGKAFLTKKHLYVHKRGHTLPSACELCPKAFQFNALLEDHIRKVHEGLELTCRWGCGWKSITKGLVTKHETKNCSLNPIPGTPYVKRGHNVRFICQVY